jgi:hypothetical protein
MRNSGGERQLFEMAHVYRAVYALRSAYDRQPVLTVTAAIAYGERILRMDRLPMPADPAASGR